MVLAGFYVAKLSRSVHNRGIVRQMYSGSMSHCNDPLISGMNSVWDE